ncbi:GntR family transcriptional regulator [Aureimonas sp. SA4125]|nr:GntR family transcriptional regulator [Aureimonas sp. SA4125]
MLTDTASSADPSEVEALTTPSLVSSNGLTALVPLERRTVHQRVYDALRRLLIEGQLDAGEVLRIQTVATKLATSTMPVRDALARLVSERALEALPNRSVRVPEATRERLDDVARARSLVEGEAIRLAAPRLSVDDIDLLRAMTKAYDKVATTGGDHGYRASYNHAFHFGIYRACGSAVLLPIIESLWLQCGPFIRASADLYDGSSELRATHFHWEILEALERADADAAVEALRRDIGRAFDLLRTRWPTQLPAGQGAGA